MKCIGETDTLSSTGPHKLSYMFRDLNMDTISGVTHVKMLLTVPPVTGKCFIDNAFCSTDDSVTQLIHISHFFKISSVLYKAPEEKIQRSQIYRHECPACF